MNRLATICIPKTIFDGSCARVEMNVSSSRLTEQESIEQTVFYIVILLSMTVLASHAVYGSFRLDQEQNTIPISAPDD